MLPTLSKTAFILRSRLLRRFCPMMLSPFWNSLRGSTSNNINLASEVSASLLRCTCFIRAWKLLLTISPSKTMLRSNNSMFASIAAVMCPKFSSTLPLRLYMVAVLLAALTIVITRTPSNFGSNSFLPAIFFSCLAPSCANIHSNKGISNSGCPALATILFTVVSLKPARMSLIRIRRYQPFHCCSVLADRASSMASRASCPVSSRRARARASSLNATQGSPCPSGPL